MAVFIAVSSVPREARAFYPFDFMHGYVISVSFAHVDVDKGFEKRDLQISDDVQILHDYVDWKASQSFDGIRDLFNEIIKRESGWHWWKCNETTVYGCGAGQGLTMVTKGTEKTCEKHFGREMDMINPYDNIDCGWWLLTDRGVKKGIGHWDNFGIPLSNGMQWGSGPYNLKSFGIQ